MPEPRVEIVVVRRGRGVIVDAIGRSAATGQIGDGKVWVSPVESVMRARTGERDEAAL